MPTKPILYMFTGAGIVLLVLGSVTLVRDRKAKESIKGIETEISDTPAPIPTSVPTESPTPTLTPTNKPVYIKPSTTPIEKSETEVITILGKTYQCEVDGIIEIREMMFKYDQVVPDFMSCLNKCHTDNNTCSILCKNRSLSEGELYSANLGSLINQYCEQ